MRILYESEKVYDDCCEFMSGFNYAMNALCELCNIGQRKEPPLALLSEFNKNTLSFPRYLNGVRIKHFSLFFLVFCFSVF